MMGNPGEGTAMAGPSHGNLARCRIAAWGGICGAVIVPAALLALYYLLQVEQPIDEISVVMTVVLAAIGVALMLLAGRVAERREDPIDRSARGLALRRDRGDEVALNQ
jgi:ABC-type uncharacterized transport system permease subunit